MVQCRWQIKSTNFAWSQTPTIYHCLYVSNSGFLFLFYLHMYFNKNKLEVDRCQLSLMADGVLQFPGGRNSPSLSFNNSFVQFFFMCQTVETPFTFHPSWTLSFSFFCAIMQVFSWSCKQSISIQWTHEETHSVAQCPAEGRRQEGQSGAHVMSLDKKTRLLRIAATAYLEYFPMKSI